MTSIIGVCVVWRYFGLKAQATGRLQRIGRIGSEGLRAFDAAPSDTARIVCLVQGQPLLTATEMDVLALRQCLAYAG